MNITLKARFIGEDGSLGYRKGRIYKITIQEPGDRYPVEIVGGGARCPYSGRAAFESNWEVLEEHDWENQ